MNARHRGSRIGSSRWKTTSWSLGYGFYWSGATLCYLLALLLVVVAGEGATEEGGGESSANSNSSASSEIAPDEDEGELDQPVYAVLFPWVAQALGIIVYFFLSRFVPAVPYTAVLFVFGTCMGAGASLSGLHDQLTQSISSWLGINSRVLFACFLPGLLFKDALEINYHLFLAGFWQIMYLAFPMVLVGTVMTALVGMYVFPYGWSLQLSLTFGSILAATDPVAVCVLLNEVGAPPRLKTHIAGEALWNDGSAVVFFAVFSTLFFNELGLASLAKEVSVAEGFIMFLRLSLGGIAVGLAFTIALVSILYLLNRRLEAEEKVLQVASTATVAYLAFYTADALCLVSGVVAVVVLGTATKAFGGGFINDWQVMDSFWSLLEHLLNTILFTLAGAEFGRIVAHPDGRVWQGSDWGYLFVLYILVMTIRFVSLFASYPLLVRMGLSTNWQETVFSGWAGLRGAVGITLALGLDGAVSDATDDPELINLTTKVFGMVGGVAFLTLIVNGPLSGPLLGRLGLIDATDARKRIVQSAEASAKRRILEDFLHAMTDPRFHFVDFALVQCHCPLLANVTAQEIEKAVREFKSSVHPSLYKQPNLNHVFPYFRGSGKLRASVERLQWDAFLRADEPLGLTPNYLVEASKDSEKLDETQECNGSSSIRAEKSDPELIKDVRLMFVELLRAAYHSQIADGELDAREYKGFLSYVLLQSLEVAYDSVLAGEPLEDWKASQVPSHELLGKIEGFSRRLCNCICSKRKTKPNDLDVSPFGLSDRIAKLRDEKPLIYQHLRLNVLRAFSFINAHKQAQERLNDEFGKETRDMQTAFQTVIEESRLQVRMAGAVLRSSDRTQVRHIVSHYLCKILQSKVARYYKMLNDTGVLLPRETRHFMHELEQQMFDTLACRLDLHPGSIEYASERDFEIDETWVDNPSSHKEAKTEDPLL